jgi:hypothetical protein
LLRRSPFITILQFHCMRVRAFAVGFSSLNVRQKMPRVIMHARHQTRVTNTRSGGFMCPCMRVFPKSRTQRDTTKCVLLLVYHEFTKIEATPMRHDFFRRARVHLLSVPPTLRDASPRGEKEKNHALNYLAFLFSCT